MPLAFTSLPLNCGSNSKCNCIRTHLRREHGGDSDDYDEHEDDFIRDTWKRVSVWERERESAGAKNEWIKKVYTVKERNNT